jgi:uncharacterized protein YkwD
VLLISPTISVTRNIADSSIAPSESTKQISQINVKANDIVSKLEKPNYISYDCDELYHQDMLKQINIFRNQNGLLDITLDGQLNSVACAHSKWLINNDRFSHQGYDDTSFNSRCIRGESLCTDESVLKNIEADPQIMFDQVIMLDTEKSKILDPDNKNIGFGFEKGILTLLYR